ncbi:MAG: hypothetical protein P0116_15685 [Candidatus Nitrosocosmicus sp.]|nr:hypothetical protein [Candidatus Nitrosocosmicus sp.]
MNESIPELVFMVLQYVLRKYLHCGPLNNCILEHHSKCYMAVRASYTG